MSDNDREEAEFQARISKILGSTVRPVRGRFGEFYAPLLASQCAAAKDRLPEDALYWLRSMSLAPCIIHCSPSEMWPNFDLLLARGLVVEESRQDEFREYRITDAGRKYLADLTSSPEDPPSC